MLTFIRAISCFWPLPIALIHGPDISGSYAILLFTASDLASITSHIHNCVLFLLWLHPFILSGVISPLISSSILGTYWPGSCSFSILSFCLFILFMGFSRQEYWSGLPFPSPVDYILSDLSTMTRPSWVAPRAWLTFIELDKAVVLVWLDWLVFCEYGFSVSALLQYLPSYLGFSYLGRGVSLHGSSSKAQPLLLTLDERYLLTTALPDLQCGIAPLGPPATS